MKILFIGDAVVPTGFARVIHSIIKFLPKDWEVHQLGVNYYGDPHQFSHHVYPASLGGDVYGFGRIKEMQKVKPDVIFILNDIWMINEYLKLIKQSWEEIPPIVVYYPADAEDFATSWFDHFNIVTHIVVYTKFGKRVTKKAAPWIEPISIIGHGTDTDVFFDMPKEEAKGKIFSDNEALMGDSFIVLNANRNQPRKRIDIAIQGFSIFAEEKDNVYYYHHAGTKDMGWNIMQLSQRYGVGGKLITTGNTAKEQRVPEEVLNIIYNATDVGINTGMGEGWGLTATEHAVTGAPQIVPDHSACKELFEDCGLLIPVSYDNVYEETLTTGKIVTPEDFAEQLEILYSDKDLYKVLAKSCQEKFLKEEYQWDTVSKKFAKIIESVV